MFRMNLRGVRSKEIRGRHDHSSDSSLLESWRQSRGDRERRKALQMTPGRSRQLDMSENSTTLTTDFSSLSNETRIFEIHELPPPELNITTESAGQAAKTNQTATHHENHIIRPNTTSAVPQTSLSNSTGVPDSNSTSNTTNSPNPTISPTPPAKANQTGTDSPTAAPADKPLPPHSQVPPGDGDENHTTPADDKDEEEDDETPPDTKPWNPRPPLNPKPATPVSPALSCSSDNKAILPYVTCQSTAWIKTHPITFVLMMIALLAYCCHKCQSRRRRRTDAARGEYRALAAHYNDDVFGDDYSAEEESIPSDEDEEYESWGTSNKGRHRTIEMKTLEKEKNGGLTLEEMNG